MTRVVGLLLFGLVAACAHAPPPPAAGATRLARNPADEVVRGVMNRYRATRRFAARFRQSNYNKTFGMPTVNDGKVYLEKPCKMRWDYFSKRDRSKVSRSQISNCTTIWAVDFGGKWSYQQSLARSTLPVAVSYMSGKGDLARAFNARLVTGSKHGGGGDKVLELTPKKPSARFKTLVLVVDPTSFWVKKSIVTSAAGDTNEFTFYEPDLARPVADTWFVFNPKTANGFREIKPANRPKPANAPTK